MGGVFQPIFFGSSHFGGGQEPRKVANGRGLRQQAEPGRAGFESKRTSREEPGPGPGQAMDISCHSLIRLARRAEPLMKDGGSILTMSYYVAEKVIDNYNMMGPVKAALEASVRYLAKELGEKKIRVNALSPGPVKTRAASGLAHFDRLMEKAAENAPIRSLVSIEQIGEAAAFLVSDKAQNITGQTIYIDNGYNTTG